MALLGTLALALFPILALYVFAKRPGPEAAIYLALGGSLFLPQNIVIDLPVFPQLHKESITFLSVLIGALAFRFRALAAVRPLVGPEGAFTVLMLACNFVTMFGNRDRVFDEGKWEAALGMHAFISHSLDDFILYVVPFWIGRAFVRTKQGLQVLMAALAGLGLIYTGIIGTEILLSIPFYVFQFNQWIYGAPIRPMWRWGILQPVAFMPNGLAVGSFMATAVLACVSLLRARLPTWYLRSRASTVLLALGTLLSWNVAAITYATVLGTSALVLRARSVMRVGVLLATVVMTYPFLRSEGFIPHEQLVAIARRFDEARAFSLEGRFLEEDFVLEESAPRLWFGWGDIDRVPNAFSFTGGGGETGIDGFWLSILGTNGLVGMLLRFAWLTLPVFISGYLFRRRTDSAERWMVACLATMVAMRAFDLLPNGLWNYAPLFLSGALFGFARSRSTVQTEPAAHVTPAAQPLATRRPRAVRGLPR